MPASESAKFLSFLCGGLSFVGCLVVTAYPEWLRNSQLSSAEFLRNQYIYHGIWWRCSSFQVGIFQCDHYDASLLGIPTDIQACRALMCIATIFSFLGTLIALLSLDCTTLIEPESKSKNYSALGAGLCFIITALSCGIAVSWFAWRITFEYFNVLYQEKEFKYEYGACLYIGWVATLFAFISGLVLIIGSCRSLNSSNNDAYSPNKPYIYKPPASSTIKPNGEKTEYV